MHYTEIRSESLRSLKNVPEPLNLSFNPSALRICDSSPVKVTFLKASAGEHHILGFYTVDGNAFKDIRLLFPDAGNDTLIPNVSSVFLGNRLNGKTPVFFLIENGFALNSNEEWFADAAAGKNGFWKFLTPCSAKGAFPVLERGETVWKTDAETTVEPAEDARLGSERPVLAWQSNDGRLFLPKGNLYHSFGYGIYPKMNPDAEQHAVLIPEGELSSVILNFATAKTNLIETSPALSVRLQIGERNFDALTRNRVACFIPLNLAKETLVEEMTVSLPETCSESLFIEGLEDQTSLPVAQRTFDVVKAEHSLTLRADAPAYVYDALYSMVKIRTSSPEASETSVRVLLKTARGDIIREGNVALLSENMLSGTIFSSLPTTLPVSDADQSSAIKRIVSAEQNADPLPAFLVEETTSPASLVKTAASLLMKSAPNGKTALITGGAKRVGRAVAFGLARRGWNVLIHCRASISEAGRLVEEIRQTFGVKAAYVKADFSDAKELEKFIPSVVETYGSFDALINNAAVFEADSFMTCTPETWAANMTINLQVPFMLSQAFVRQLPKDKNGDIVNILDQRVLNPTPYFTSYTLSKSGLALLTKTAALALAPQVKVNAVAPGDVFPTPKQSKSDFERRCMQTPLGKACPADEIADAVALILDSSCMTGQILALDSGQSLNWSFENKAQK